MRNIDVERKQNSLFPAGSVIKEGLDGEGGTNVS